MSYFSLFRARGRSAATFVGTILSIALLVCVSVGMASSTSEGDLCTQSPSTGVVYQRDSSDFALVPINGTCSRAATRIEARAKGADDHSPALDWTTIDRSPHGSFAGHLKLKAGWYRIEIRQHVPGEIPVSHAVEQVGVGEVFIVVGHSVAQGGEINLDGAQDERVRTIPLNSQSPEMLEQYGKSANPRFLPPLAGSQFRSGIVPAPFGHGTYFWARFAEQVSKAQQVPVMLLNAAFGGTSLDHWAKSAKGIPFEHSFVNARVRMPYANLRNALKCYAAHTGLRALLSDQGQNDWPEADENVILANYKIWIRQARADLGFEELAVVVNRQTPPGEKAQVRRAQERLTKELLHCFPGPDYDTLERNDRTDGIHLSHSGAEKTARMWAEALTSDFFRNSKPYAPSHPVPANEDGDSSSVQ